MADRLRPPNEQTIEHLKLISQVIERIGRNSFQLKAWTVILVAAILRSLRKRSTTDTI